MQQDSLTRWHAAIASATQRADWATRRALLESASLDGIDKMVIARWRMIEFPHIECLQKLTRHRGYVLNVAWSPDGVYLATTSTEEIACIWEAASGRVVVTLIGHTAGVYDLAWSPDGAYLATASDDETARIWGEQ